MLTARDGLRLLGYCIIAEYLGTLYECLHQIVTLFCLRYAFLFAMCFLFCCSGFFFEFSFFCLCWPFWATVLIHFLNNWVQDNLTSSNFDMTPGFQPFAIVLFTWFFLYQM